MDTKKLRALPINFVAQNPNEKVYFLLRKHFIANTPWLTACLLLTIVPFIFLSFSHQLAFWTTIPTNTRLYLIVLWFTSLLGYALLNLAKWHFHSFLITDHRVMDIDLVGLLYRNVAETQLKLIQDVSHTQGGILQLIFNYGSVFVQTAATRQQIELTGVSDPGEIHDIITDLAAEAGNSYEHLSS
ncbi:PH domain-containing protein [Patescibacteria group bacterium]|nr:PH domain-containing protein [Patescibacteria group bacterium]